MQTFRKITERKSDGVVIHISSLNDRSTEVVMADRITIGATDECDVKIRLPEVAAAKATGPVIELARANGVYRIASYESSLEVTLNGRPIRSNKTIDDGDEIWIGPNGPSIHFFPIQANAALVPGRRGGAHVAPFIEQAAMEASTSSRRDDAKIFLREFTRELVREINPSTKIIAFAILIALVIGSLYIGFGVVNELRRTRRINDDLRAQTEAAKAELERTNQQLKQLGESNNNIIRSLSLAAKLRADYGSGVALIYGSYVFVEAGTGRELRYPESQANESGNNVQSGSDSTTLTPEGNGAIAEYDFVGTGFHVGNGYLLTNRHVVRPWDSDDRAQSLNSTVRGLPRLKKLVAYFPDQAQPLGLKFKQASSRDDVAVCTLDVKDVPQNVPVLPLEGDANEVVGNMVVTMGYPNGPDRLLALLDENEARGVLARYGSVEASLGYLAQTKHIQPLMTQGNITDLNARKIVYDARTGEGGSGAPLFGPSGRVIGVTFAVFTENTASNFAVPVRYALTLLERAGWKAPETPEAEPKEASNAGPGSTH
ncbi:MAG TPA: trypsin-like peptidase domain-containing protein [Pyrinomonadaceae bacterium]|nr:trypsin-like peptidase domain-containing protein [Pyrinomonadaceae bacterium]